MKLFRFFVFLLSFLIALFVFLAVFVHPFLSINKPIKSKNLVIDAWLSGYELETIMEESLHYDLEKIFVIGKKFENDAKSKTKLSDFESDEYFRWRKNKIGVLLLTNSSLLVDISKLSNSQIDSIHTITIKTSDTQFNNVYAHFNVSLNGIWLGSSFVNDSLKEYSFFLNASSEGNPLLAIYFDNDYQGENESRNLYLESIKVNGDRYELEETNSIITRQESLLTTGFNSEAAQTANYLKALNVDFGIIEILEFEINGQNQTLAAALKLKEHLQNTKLKGLNVSSTGLHARRTFFTYEKVLKLDQVGIFNVQVEMFDRNYWYKSVSGIHTMLDEFASYVYVWFYLQFM